ncbi:MAG: hypothetical protein WCW64_00650 [Phycisphaerae bacterium]|jgi:hypothetical protein
MVAYKNSPGQDETSLYQKQKYRSSNSPSSVQHAHADNESLDRIAESYQANKLYQRRIEPRQPSNEYDLLQPVWFEEIRKRLASGENEKEKKKTPELSQKYIFN